MWGGSLRTVASAQPTIPEPSVDAPPPNPSTDDDYQGAQSLGLPKSTNDGMWREGSSSVASARPNLPEPTVDEPPPDPSTDDDYQEAQYLGLPESTNDDMWREGSMIVACARPNLPEPAVDEPPPVPEPISDDEDEDASPDKENRSYKANCELPTISLDIENDCYNVSCETPFSGSVASLDLENECYNGCETPLSGSSKSSLSFAAPMTPASVEQIDLYTEDLSLHVGSQLHTKDSQCNHKCLPNPDPDIQGSEHSSRRRKRDPFALRLARRGLQVLQGSAHGPGSEGSQPKRGLLSGPSPCRQGPSSPKKLVGAYAGWFSTESAVSAAGNTEFYALASFLKPSRPLKPHETRQLLRDYGYRGINRATNKFSDPSLSVSLEHHFERAGYTWYELKCSLRPERTAGNTDGIVWVVHRRLAMLRRDLHDRIKAELGKVAYSELFEENKFPSRGGIPGTSARLKKWFAALAEWINSGNAPSWLIAHVLKFLELPAVARRLQYIEEEDEQDLDTDTMRL